MRLGVREAAALLARTGSAALLGHLNPDGDCLGSMYALAAALQAAGKRAVPILGEEVPMKHRNLRPLLAPGQEIPEDCELLIVLDTPEKRRLERPAESLPDLPALCLDHHPGDHGDFAWACFDETMPAAVMLVLQVIRELGAAITPDMALALYAGLLTDTNSFTNRNTTSGALSAAAELAELGADPGTAADLVYQSRRPCDITILGRVLERLEMHAGGRIALLQLPLELRGDCPDPDLEDFVNYARSILGVEVAVMLTELPGAVRVNLRSKGGADVRAAALPLGGGGHKAAAGIRLRTSLAEARTLVLESILKNTLQPNG